METNGPEEAERWSGKSPHPTKAPLSWPPVREADGRPRPVLYLANTSPYPWSSLVALQPLYPTPPGHPQPTQPPELEGMGRGARPLHQKISFHLIAAPVPGRGPEALGQEQAISAFLCSWGVSLWALPAAENPGHRLTGDKAMAGGAHPREPTAVCHGKS